jgi:hypothetical protein
MTSGRTAAGRGQSPRSGWARTSALLDAYRKAAERADDPGTAGLLRILEGIDAASAVRGRLDRAAVEGTPRKLWGRFLAQYTAASVTAMAEKAGILTTLERSGLVIFPFAGSPDPMGSLRARAPDASGESDDLPALVPLSRAIPFFSADYLGLLQGRLDWLIANKRLFKRPGAEDPGSAASLNAAREGVKPVRLYQETRKSLLDYLQLCEPEKDAARIGNTASKGAPFVFLWLSVLGLLDDLLDGLLQGAPVIRRPDGPKDVFGFQRSGADQPSGPDGK